MATIEYGIGDGAGKIKIVVRSWFATDARKAFEVAMVKMETVKVTDLVSLRQSELIETHQKERAEYIADNRQLSQKVDEMERRIRDIKEVARDKN